MIRWLYPLVAAVDVVATGLRVTALEWGIKPLITLLLVWYLVTTPGRAPRPLVLGLSFAFVGDMLLMVPGTVLFLAGMAAFLGMQICYLIAFRRAGSRPGWQTIAGYAVMWVAANVLLWPHLGGLAVPILCYSVALTSMAAFGAGLNRRVGLGALLFLASDLMIGAGTAGLHPPAEGVLVMATYAAAQYLIVTGYRPAAPVVVAEPVISPA
jgi:uncharacterized membrane protein YhhN